MSERLVHQRGAGRAQAGKLLAVADGLRCLFACQRLVAVVGKVGSCAGGQQVKRGHALLSGPLFGVLQQVAGHTLALRGRRGGDRAQQAVVSVAFYACHRQLLTVLAYAEQGEVGAAENILAGQTGGL